MSDKGETAVDISVLRRRRGVAKASLTRLKTRLIELEAKVSEPSTLSHAHKLSPKLESLDSEFKAHHYTIVDALADNDQLEENLAKEQDELDQHDMDIAELSVRLEELIGGCTPKSHSTAYNVATRSLTDLRERLTVISSALAKLSGAAEEIHLIEQHQEQIADLKKELYDTRQNVISSCTPEEADEHAKTIVVDVDRLLFDVGATLKMKLPSKTPRSHDKATADLPREDKMVKLPKIDTPTFNGDILNWLTFWEQYRVAIHDRTDLPQAQKLVYLRQSLKGDSARNVIEGLSRSGEQYDEAVKCLQERYDRPRLIHQAHVRKIVEAPGLKDNSGRELRRLHDTLQQHLRALHAMGKEPSPSFTTSLIEMKLDPETMFEWQKASQDSTDVPPYAKLLEFLNLRAQASEFATSEPRKNPRSDPYPIKKHPSNRSVSHFVSVGGDSSKCVVCKDEKHPLYACTRFKALPQGRRIATLKENNLCMNCLKPGHFARQCTNMSRCRRCQKSHHTLIHSDSREAEQTEKPSRTTTAEPATCTSAHAATGFASNTLLMTCQLLVHSPDSTALKARALLDSASSTTFISDRLTQALQLHKSSRNIKISGIAGLTHHSPLHSVVNFDISPTSSPREKIQVSAVAVPRVAGDLPSQPVHWNASWAHLSDLQLADPDFGRTGKVDTLLGIDVYANVLLHGRRNGPPDSPVAFETKFGWVLAGRTNSSSSHHCVASYHVSATSCDQILSKFWEIEESPKNHALTNLSPEEQVVVDHFDKNHRRSESGRFIVPLPRKPQAKSIGESRSQAVRRFLSLERSLHAKGRFQEFSDVIEEYFEMQHAELVPTADLQKPPEQVFYLPIHAVRKEHSTTTKIRVVFDASAKSSSGVSLNDTLLVGPTIHSPLLDVLLRFRSHRIALIADVSKMYRAIELVPADQDLHRFVWRKETTEPLKDYRMTRLTFGISASSFAANMAVKQNACDLSAQYPLAAQAVERSFYVDDCLTGADTVQDATQLQGQLQKALPPRRVTTPQVEL